MNDYTPTTEEVRDFVTQTYGNDSSLARARAEAVGLWFDNWLAEHDRQVAEKAWEEGYATGDADALTENRLDTPNPHQQGETE